MPAPAAPATNGEAAPDDGGALPAPAPGNAAPPDTGTEASYRRNSAILNVSVPAEAKVYVNGYLTKSTGERRSYISRNLVGNSSYKFELRAELIVDGEKIEQVKSIDLRAGQNESLAFDLRPENPETTLTLHVPEDAKVTLGGAETSATGTVRVFSTKTLPKGQQWSDYKVVVTLDREGNKLSKEQTISLKSGDTRDLTFDFDEAKVAVAQ